MKHLAKLPFIVLFLLVGINSSLAKEKKDGTQQAILLTAFGTSVPKANKAYKNIEEEFRKAFPDKDIQWAYTSSFIRKKLRKRGQKIHSPAMALSKLAEDGYDQIFVQSLHVIPGSEYHNLLNTAKRFEGMPEGIKNITIVDPLLTSNADMHNVSKAMIENIPEERNPDEAVVFMGHGSHHAANIYYPGMQYYLWNRDNLLFVGTVEGAPKLDEVLQNLQQNQIEKVWLSPLMAVAGDHAKNDMAGEEADSWKSVLESKGYKVKTVLKGMAEYDNIVSVWIDHLRAAMSEKNK